MYRRRRRPASLALIVWLLAASEGLLASPGRGGRSGLRPLVAPNANSLYYPLDEPLELPSVGSQEFSAAGWRPAGDSYAPPSRPNSSLSLIQLLPSLLRLLASLHRLLALESRRPNIAAAAAAASTGETAVAVTPISTGAQQLAEPLLAELGKQLLSAFLRAPVGGAQETSERPPWWLQLGAELLQLGPLIQSTGAKPVTKLGAPKGISSANVGRLRKLEPD